MDSVGQFHPTYIPPLNPHQSKALVFGIATLGIGVFAGVPAIIFGVKGRAFGKRHGGPTGKSTFGLVMGVLSILLALIFIGVAAGSAGSFDYHGADLADDVTRVVESNGSTAESVTCENVSDVQAGSIADCTATIDGKFTGIRVTFDDDEGHFTISEQAS